MEQEAPLAVRKIDRARWTRHALNNGLIFRATCFGVTRLPVRVSYAIGKVGTWLAYRLMSDATKGIISNLRGAFPSLHQDELQRLALRTYRSYAYDTIDLLKGLSTDPATLSNRLISFDKGVFDRLLGHGKGILLVGAHLGNWEMGAVFLRRLYGYPLTVVAMAEESPTTNEIRREIRSSLGVDTLEVRQSIDTPVQILRVLSENRIVAMLIDRHVGRDRMPVQFFKRQAYFLRTPAVIAYLSGAPLLPALLVRDGEGRFTGVTGEPIYVDRNGPRDACVALAVQRFASFLEQQVQKHPHLWYQFFHYWKDQELKESEVSQARL